MRKFITMCAITFMANLFISAFAASENYQPQEVVDYPQAIAGTWEATQMNAMVEVDGELSPVNIVLNDLSTDDWRKEHYYTLFEFTDDGSAFEYHAVYEDNGKVSWQQYEGETINYAIIDGNKIFLKYCNGGLDAPMVSKIEELTKDNLVLRQTNSRHPNGKEKTWTQITYKRVNK